MNNYDYTVWNCICAFFLGVREYKTDLTQHFEDMALLEYYDRGRNIARAVTWRD